MLGKIRNNWGGAQDSSLQIAAIFFNLLLLLIGGQCLGLLENNCNKEPLAPCSGQGLCEGEGEGCSTEKQETPAFTKDVLKGFVCYSCSLVMDRINTVPGHIIDDVQQLAHRKTMKSEIKDFLL